MGKENVVPREQRTHRKLRGSTCMGFANCVRNPQTKANMIKESLKSKRDELFPKASSFQSTSKCLDSDMFCPKILRDLCWQDLKIIVQLYGSTKRCAGNFHTKFTQPPTMLVSGISKKKSAFIFEKSQRMMRKVTRRLTDKIFQNFSKVVGRCFLNIYSSRKLVIDLLGSSAIG